MLTGGCPLDKLIEDTNGHQIIKIAGSIPFNKWCYSIKIHVGNYIKYIGTLVNKEYYLFQIDNKYFVSLHYTQLHHIIVMDPF